MLVGGGLLFESCGLSFVEERGEAAREERDKSGVGHCQATLRLRGHGSVVSGAVRAGSGGLSLAA